jgi:hypothetical protein
MTEAEWLVCTDPKPMLDFLQFRSPHRKTSDRKFRLFSVACCRRIWHFLADERSTKAVKVVEQFADREPNQKTMKEAVKAAWEARSVSPSWAARAAYEAARDSWQTARAAGRAGKVHGDEKEFYAETQAQGLLIRDLFGPLPFRPVSIDPAWLTWYDGLLVSMSQKMYDSRDFSNMPILADALVEAGCTNADILAHCREPGEHVRGCWVLDLLLGKS